MNPNTYIAKASVTLRAPVEKVWEALTNPEIVKKYFFGTTVESDWQVGSPITYTGEWEGKPYTEKGIILAVEPNKQLKSTYYTASNGPDIPENYNVITYDLRTEGASTTLQITQTNIKSEESAKHSEANWNTVLAGLEKLLEQE